VQSELRPQVVRITLALEREVTFSERRLVDPPRVFIDLHDVAPSAAVENATVALGDPIVRRLRVVPLPGRRTQIAIDLVAPADYSVYALYNPFRLVIDFERRGRRTAAAATGGATAARRGAAATDSAAVIGSAAPRPPSANAAGGFSLSRQLGLRAARIVIDPGHGGHDPGTETAGLTEAALVLDVALRLERLLTRGNHAEVVLTRRDDTFVPLEERTATANRGEADLFLSIHANAHAAAAVRGVETYVLNFAATPEAEALAARENAASSRSMRELPDLVRAIAADNKLDESRDFARIVQRTLYQRLRTVNKGLKNLGVKQAPFMVLVGARMPAILAEIAFMTNRQDAALLRTDRYRQQIAEALLAGITGYQETLKKVALAGGS
jgi:N-acetylmuramoyl-L-alanine amidase